MIIRNRLHSPLLTLLLLPLLLSSLSLVLAHPDTNLSKRIYLSTADLEPRAVVPAVGTRVGEGRKGKKPEYVAHPAGDLVCRPFGECSPCPKDELDQPFCLPYGNRRLLHCIPAGTDKSSSASQGGEVPAWEGCGKVVKKERQDFWEFVTANLLFLIVALTVLWARTSALATEQYRQLAARIGITTGGWTAAT
ncbi:hypothetical protein IAT38_005407 [Cryptococcus sp. DSM 104549]